MRMIRLALTVALAAGSLFAQAGDITGAGSTFAYPIFAKWADAYKTSTGVGLNYQAIGSGGGIKQITSRTVDFGASDMPLTSADLTSKGLMQFPAIMGGVVPVINLQGVPAGKLRLDGKVLASIYMGDITQWNDPAIAALNPGVKLPDELITVVRRADASGTTFIFTSYLSKVSANWKSKVGCNTAVAWPVGVAGKGNPGVAAYVQRIRGAIGYVEYAYALTNHMNHSAMVNAAGKTVEPSIEAFQAAAAYADWTHAPNFYQVLTNEPGATTWPIAGASFVLLPTKVDNAARVKEVMKFFSWSFAKGQPQARQLDYVPMPANVVKLIEQDWTQEVKDKSGHAIW